MSTKVVYVGNLPGDVSEKVSTYPVGLLTGKGPLPCLVWWGQHQPPEAPDLSKGKLGGAQGTSHGANPRQLGLFQGEGVRSWTCL
jgi:hypothetical protein